MKLLNVFDCYKIIRNHEELKDVDEELIYKLDEMLDQAGVAHAFMECRSEEIEADDNAVVTVIYNEEDDTKFFLTYALFIKIYRGASDEMINRAMQKRMSK